jgi:hypothetical protein
MSLTEQHGGPTAKKHVTDRFANSSLYREFLAEREEILKHKWCESEKAGRDIGLDAALVSWRMRHRSLWLRAWRMGRW